jgi:hypothetical protein
MLTKETFQEVLAAFSINFGLKFKDEDEAKAYKTLIYNSLKTEITDQDFKERAGNIMQQTTNKDWNDAYGYGGKPSVKDWIDAFIPPEQWIEQEQNYKCSITGANLVRRVMVKVNNQLKVTKE